MGFR
ncbi:methyl-accepting chemotaxis (MCP) signaling domain protein, partial [Vibrio parahaemolyticus VPTS-2009]